jgi:lysophospholipase L1-like esterase
VLLRLALYACLLPPIAVAMGIGKRSSAAAGMAIGVAVCAVGYLWPRTRRAAGAVYARSRILRIADTALWNVALVLVIAEFALTVASHVTNHPLLASPNASTQARIEKERESLIAFYGAGGANTRGFNDTEWRPNPSDVFRIIALGDSFAFGVVGYQDNFLTRLEGDLAARLGRPVEVANLGLPSMQPREYLQILVDDGLALRPDLILLCLYSGNDFQPSPTESRFDARNWRVVGFVSRVARYAAERDFRTSAAPVAGAPVTGNNAPAFTEHGYLQITDALIPLLRREPTAKVERGLRETLALADEIVARARPTPVVVAVLPSEVQVNPLLREQLLARAQLAEADLDLDHPARATRSHFEPQQIPVVDLLGALTAAEQTAPTYAPRNTHWNERGNAVAAQALADALAPVVRAQTAGDAATR